MYFLKIISYIPDETMNYAIDLTNTSIEYSYVEIRMLEWC